MQAHAESLEVVLRAHGAAPVRLTPPGRIATPVRGVHKIESGQDPTVPASAQDLEAMKKRPVTDDEQKRAGAAPTISSSTTGEKLPAREAPARKVPWVALGLSVFGLAALGIAGAMVLGKSDDRPTDEPTFVVVDQRASADKPIEAAIADAPVLGIDAGTEPAAAAPIDAGTKTVKKTQEADLAAALTHVFARQNAAITSCFKQHPTKFEGQLSIRFQVDVNGKVTTAEIAPSSVGGTSLGTCIIEIAKRTSFGPQPMPVAFKVPLVTMEN
jgi:hypothetical protein